MTTCVEIFAGAGGSAIGLSKLKLKHVALVEQNPDACATLREAGLGPVVEGDVRKAPLPEADVLWSSFPCQAWSAAGKRKGAADERNGWPWTVDAIDKVKPTWFVAENVCGLTFHRKDCDRSGAPEECPACYFEGVILEGLRERFDHVGWWVLDAADYGIPQHRKRVFIWAGPKPVSPPQTSHGHGMFSHPHVSVSEALNLSCGERVIGGGSNPRKPGRAQDRTYTDLTNRPSTTVTAVRIGNAGPWVTLDEERRLLTLSELALLQGFPEAYPFHGSSSSKRRQIGNAVPPKMAEVVMRAVLGGKHA